MLVLKNCRLIPELTEGYDAQLADLVIDGQLIADIVKPGSTNFESCDVQDMEGRTVLPGLFDLHMHAHGTNRFFIEMSAKKLGQCCFDAYYLTRTLMTYGFTTQRDMGSNERCGIALRNAINRGQVGGPRFTSCGHIVAPTESGSDLFYLLHNDGDGCDEMLKRGRQEMQAGCDFIKTNVTGGFLNEGGDPSQCIITMPELQTLVNAAKAKGRYVAVHCHSAEGVKMSVRAGVRTIEHGSLVDEAGLEMLQGSQDSFIIPTMFPLASMAKMAESDSTAEKVLKAKKFWPMVVNSLSGAYKAGLKLGWGTDILLPEFLENPAGEFLYRRDYLGMSNIDLLLQATKYSAEIIGTDDKTGTIKKGKYADLAVFTGNPDEDIAVMGNPAYAVFKSGEQYEYKVRLG